MPLREIDEQINPPTFTFSYNHPNSEDPSVLHYVVVPLKRYQLPLGFGERSESWWPSGPLAVESIMNEEIHDDFKHSDGAILGTL